MAELKKKTCEGELINLFMDIIKSSFPCVLDIKKHYEWNLKFRNMIKDDKPYLWYLICKSLHLLSKNYYVKRKPLVNWFQVHLDALMMESFDAHLYISKHGQCGIIFPYCRSMPANINDTPDTKMDIFKISQKKFSLHEGWNDDNLISFPWDN